MHYYRSFITTLILACLTTMVSAASVQGDLVQRLLSRQANADLLRAAAAAQQAPVITAQADEYPAVYAYYTGYGFEAKIFDDATGQPISGDDVSWQMDVVTLEGEDGIGRPALKNVLPPIQESSFFSYVEFPDSHTIRIPAQSLWHFYNEEIGQDIHIWVFSPLSSDNSITLTVDDKGEISTDQSIILYGLFTSADHIDLTDDNSYLGYYTYMLNVAYYSPGQEPTDPFEVTASYTGHAVDPDRGFQSWNMSFGILTEPGKNPVATIRNLIPTVKYVEYFTDGNDVCIDPTLVNMIENTQTGQFYYLILFNPNSEDGAIVLHRNEEGLIQHDNLSLVIGIFNSARFSLNNDNYMGAYSLINKVNYYASTEALPLNAEYAPDNILLYNAINFDGYTPGLPQAYAPAKVPVTFRNDSPDRYQSASWTISEAEWSDLSNTFVTGKDYANGSEDNFTVRLEADLNYTMPSLTIQQGERQGHFTWGQMTNSSTLLTTYPQRMPGYITGDSWMWSTANMDFGIGPWDHLATPKLNSQRLDIETLVLYQGKPAPGSALNCSGITMLVLDAQGQPSDLTCQIVRATRYADTDDLELGDVLYESNTAEIVHNFQDLYTLSFSDFYYDVDGMTQGVEYLNIADEFAVVIRGWNKGTFQGSPEGENYCNVNDLTSTFFYLKNDEKLRRFANNFSKIYVGFETPVMGYILTNDDTHIRASEQGGTYTLTVEPHFCKYAADGKTFVTDIQLEENLMIDGMPDWISYEFVNEKYDENGDGTVDIKLTVKPMPAGIEGRQEHIYFAQDGGRLDVTVSQGSYAGIQEVITDAADAPAGRYNLYGLPVSADYRGFTVSHGHKAVVK